MGIEHAIPGKVVNLLAVSTSLDQAKTTTLVKSSNFEAIRLCVHAGHVIPVHKTKGSITVQCMEGQVLFTVGEVDNEMHPGDWLYLEKEQVHSLRGIKDSLLLLTIMFP